MVNISQIGTKRLRMAERAEKQREVLFPEVSTDWLWRRQKNNGYTTVPRTLPIVMEAIDALSKSQPAGHTYFGLWCRSPDHPVLTIENPATLASEAGFKGERAVDTWKRRVRTLRDEGFIVTKPGAAGEFHYVLLLNPNLVMEWLRARGRLQDSVYAKFHDRSLEIGSYGDIEQYRGMQVPLGTVPAAPPSTLSFAPPPSGQGQS
jgi:hypothetical protein